MDNLRQKSLVLSLGVCLAAACSLVALDEPALTEEQIREFLLNAKVVNSKQWSKGVTGIWRLTLSDGTLTHDVAFQSIDERKPFAQMASGATEMNFRDYYGFNIAAFELAKLLGLGDMIPVTVKRKWKGSDGAFCWWVPAKWDEGARLKEKLQSPDVNAFNKQMNKMWVFSQLVYDTDRNQGNILITEDWKCWMIDFTRAFRLFHKLEDPRRLVQCDRELLEKLRQLNEADVMAKTRPYLSKSEVKAVMARRDLIVAYFEKLIAQKGEGSVLY